MNTAEVVFVEAATEERTSTSPAMSPARRLLPWFFWAQVLPAIFLGSRPVPFYVAMVGILGLVAWGVTRKPHDAAGLLGLVRPRGENWLRVTGLLMLPVIIWPRIAGIPFSLIWPEAPVPVYPDSGPPPAILLAVVLLGPLAEELLFRGVLLAALRPYGKFAALAVSSVIFGMLHGPVAFLSTVMVGWAVGWLAWEYGSIVPGLAIHVAFNLASAFGAFALARTSEAAAVAAVGVLLAATLVALAVTVRHRRLIAGVIRGPWRQRHVPGVPRPVIETLKLWPVTVTLIFTVLGWVLQFAGEV